MIADCYAPSLELQWADIDDEARRLYNFYKKSLGELFNEGA